MAFCLLSSGHSSVCQIKDLFLQACPRQSALEQGWQVVSHCFMITERHLALRNLLLWKQKEQFCALLLLLIPLYHREPQRWGKKHHNSISCESWLGRKVKDKENWWHLPLQRRQNFTHWFCFFGSKERNESERNRETLLIKDSPPGNPSSLHGCYSQYWYRRLENSPTQQTLQTTTIYNPQNLYLVESLLL